MSSSLKSSAAATATTAQSVRFTGADETERTPLLLRDRLSRPQSPSQPSTPHNENAAFRLYILPHLSAAVFESLADPVGEYRRLWILLLFTFLLYNAISIPLRLAFIRIADDPLAVAAFAAVDYSGDVFFLLDVWLHFHTPFIKDGMLEKSQAEMTAHYVSGWFAADFISSAPVDLLFLPFLGLYATVPIRMTRLIRLVKYESYFFVWEQYSTRFPQFIRFSKLILGMMLILHWLACFWFWCGYAYGFGVTTWLPAETIKDEPLADQYIFAFWWATNIVTQVGGDPGLATNRFERIMNLFISFLSVFVVAVVIGNVNELVSELNAEEGKLREKLQLLNRFMLTRRLPLELQDRIRTYFRNSWIRKGGVDDQSIMSELPSKLRKEIGVLFFTDILNQSIFNEASDEFKHELVQSLQLHIYVPNEIIFSEGEEGHEIYFVSRGKVNLLRNGVKFDSVKEGDCFGEIAVVKNETRGATAQADNYCHLFFLTRDDMTTLFDKYAEQKNLIHWIADSRKARDALTKTLKLVNLLEFAGLPPFIQDDTTKQVSEIIKWFTNFNMLKEIEQVMSNDFMATDNGEVVSSEGVISLFEQGQVADTLFFVSRGAVEIVVSELKPPTIDTDDVDGEANYVYQSRVVTTVREGQFFGCVRVDSSLPETYQVGARITREFCNKTTLLQLNRDKMSDINAFLSKIQDNRERHAFKRALRALLQRFVTEDDYAKAIQPVPPDLSRAKPSISKARSVSAMSQREMSRALSIAAARRDQTDFLHNNNHLSPRTLQSSLSCAITHTLMSDDDDDDEHRHHHDQHEHQHEHSVSNLHTDGSDDDDSDDHSDSELKNNTQTRNNNAPAATAQTISPAHENRRGSVEPPVHTVITIDRAAIPLSGNRPQPLSATANAAPNLPTLITTATASTTTPPPPNTAPAALSQSDPPALQTAVIPRSDESSANEPLRPLISRSSTLPASTDSATIAPLIRANSVANAISHRGRLRHRLSDANERALSAEDEQRERGADEAVSRTDSIVPSAQHTRNNSFAFLSDFAQPQTHPPAHPTPSTTSSSRATPRGSRVGFELSINTNAAAANVNFAQPNSANSDTLSPTVHRVAGVTAAQMQSRPNARPFSTALSPQHSPQANVTVSGGSTTRKLVFLKAQLARLSTEDLLILSNNASAMALARITSQTSTNSLSATPAAVSSTRSDRG